MHVRHVLLELRPKAKGPDDEGKETKYELSISAIAWKKSRAPTFAFMKQLQGLAASAIADVPGLKAHGQASFCCPGCTRLKLDEASWYSVDETSSKKLTCDKCSEVIELNKAPQLLPLNLGRYLGMPLNTPVIAKWENYGIKDLKVTSDKMRLGRPLESQVSLYKQLGLKTSQTEDKEDIEYLKSLTEQSIVDEITAKARELGDKSPTDAPDGGKGGWTDLEWLLYITAPSAKEAVQRKAETNGEENSEAAKMANERIKLQRQAKERGIDAGRADSSLDWFLKRPVIVAAGLSRAHVLALRLYASSVYRRINAPLYNGCSSEKPHWYPSTVLLLSDALGKLRNAQVERAASRLRYIEVTNAQHFDSFLPFAGYDTRFVPLHLYFNRAMDAMWAHLKNGTALPGSQVVRTTLSIRMPQTCASVGLSAMARIAMPVR
jgi:hypothetical protein